MMAPIDKLKETETFATQLFEAIELRNLIRAGKSEKELNQEIYDLAYEMFGIKKYWHKRIVRAGINTLSPYDDNPPNLVLQEDDILFLDFGPVFEDWEADFGRTFVIGNDASKHKLKLDIEKAWYEVRDWFVKQNSLTGSEFYSHILSVTQKFGYDYGGQLAGHLIGHFPHEKLEPKNYGLYVHPENPNDMFLPDKEGNNRHWILEIHFVDRKKQIGGFFEQLLI